MISNQYSSYDWSGVPKSKQVITISVLCVSLVLLAVLLARSSFDKSKVTVVPVSGHGSKNVLKHRMTENSFLNK